MFSLLLAHAGAAHLAARFGGLAGGHVGGHGVAGIQRAEAALAVPALHGTEAGSTHGLGGGVDLALAQVFHHPGEAVQPVAEHARQAVLGKNFGGFVGTLRAEAVFLQHALKLGQHGFIRYSHGCNLPLFQLFCPVRTAQRETLSL